MSESMPQRRPALTEELAGEMLIYLPEENTAHLLSADLAELYRACDGRPRDPVVQHWGQEKVEQALDEFALKGLILPRRGLLAGATALFATLLLPSPAVASSACLRATGSFAGSSCPQENPPQNCLPCCAAEGGAPACDNNCDDLQCGCFCLQGRRCPDGDCTVGSCLSDIPLGVSACAHDNSLLDQCGKPGDISVCLSNCQLARLNAAEAGVDHYFCCGNCF